MKDDKCLVDIISRILRFSPPKVMISEKEIDTIDFKGKDDIEKKRLERAIFYKGKASILYFQASQASYYLRDENWDRLIRKTVYSADRAAEAAYLLKLRMNVRPEDRAAAKAEPYLSDLAGNCHIELRDFGNACFAYLKSAKAHIMDFRNKAKAKELKTIAEAIDSSMEINLLKGDADARIIYEFLINNLKEN